VEDTAKWRQCKDREIKTKSYFGSARGAKLISLYSIVVDIFDTVQQICLFTLTLPWFSQNTLFQPSTPNTFCQLGLAATASHNTASFDFDANVGCAGAGSSGPIVRGAEAGSGEITSLASANPPPTCSSSRASAAVPLSRILPPDRTTSSCSHAARCTSTIEICSPVHDK